MVEEAMAMLMRLDRCPVFNPMLTQPWGQHAAATPTPTSLASPTNATLVPMDVYRDGDQFVVAVELPGVDPSAVELAVEHNVLTITARRSWPAGKDTERLIAERPHGVFSRQLLLSDAVDTEAITADYDAGVLTVTIPVAERAKPRSIEVNGGAGRPTG